MSKAGLLLSIGGAVQRRAAHRAALCRLGPLFRRSDAALLHGATSDLVEA